MLPSLESLIVLQELDTAAEVARRRLAELPSVEKQLDQQIGAATAAIDEVRARSAENQQFRKDLEKQVAVIDGRLARFDEHKASVKTNQEFTALLHEIETARAGKDDLEGQILVLMEEADQIAAALGAAELALTAARRETDAARAGLAAEKGSLEDELDRLNGARAGQTGSVDPVLLAKYEQLLKQRRMVAVAPLKGDVCGACHVRLRPAVSQQVRRGAEIVTCDSCQRILYALPPPEPEAADPSAPPAQP